MRSQIAFALVIVIASRSWAEEPPSPTSPPAAQPTAPPAAPPTAPPTVQPEYELPPYPPVLPPCQPLAPAPCCPCTAAPTPWPPAPKLVDPSAEMREEAEHEARFGLGLGISFLVIGEALALGHALDARTPTALYELTPVIGPAVGLFREQPDTGWATALVFSSWFEAAGIVVLAAAASYLSHSHEVQLDASIDRNGGGSLVVRGRF